VNFAVAAAIILALRRSARRVAPAVA